MILSPNQLSPHHVGKVDPVIRGLRLKTIKATSSSESYVGKVDPVIRGLRLRVVSGFVVFVIPWERLTRLLGD